MGSVKSAFNACIAAKSFGACDTRQKIGVNECPQCVNEADNAPLYCADFKAEIGGQEWRGCLSINASDSSATESFSQGLCYNDDGAGPGNSGSLVLVPDATTTPPTTADTVLSPSVECTTNQDCTNAGGVHCGITAGNTGLCNATSAKCG